MNKKITAVAAIVLVFAMLFAMAGCSQKAEEEETTIAVKTPGAALEEVSGSANGFNAVVTEPLTAKDGNGIEFYCDKDGNKIEESDVHFLNYEEALKRDEVNFSYFKSCLKALTDGDVMCKISHSEKKSIGKQVLTFIDENGEQQEKKIKYTGTPDEYADGNDVINASVDTIKNYMLVTEGHDDLAYPEKGKTMDAEAVKAYMPWATAMLNVTPDLVKSCTVVDSDTTRRTVVTFYDFGDDSPMKDCFDSEDREAAFAEVEKASDYCTVDRSATTFNYSGCSVVMVTDLTTDAIIKLECSKVVDIDSVVTGTGTLESVGTLPIHLAYTFKNTYDVNTECPYEE